MDKANENDKPDPKVEDNKNPTLPQEAAEPVTVDIVVISPSAVRQVSVADALIEARINNPKTERKPL